MTILSKIESIFGFEVQSFFTNYLEFTGVDLHNIILFYKGNRDSSIEISKKKLEDLTTFSKKISEKIESSKFQFNTAEFYEFVDEFEDINLKLLSYSNLKKWIGVNYNQSTTVNYTLSKNESLDKAASRVGYSDKDMGEIEISLNNLIKETDYDLSGGFSFQVNYQSENSTISADTLIGENLINEELLGRDLSKVLSFVDNDLDSLLPNETFSQTCEILIKFLRGDNPEFPFKGMDKTLVTNRVSASTSLPILLRQLSDLISGDGTVDRMILKDVSYEKDSIKFKCDLYSKFNNIYSYAD